MQGIYLVERESVLVSPHFRRGPTVLLYMQYAAGNFLFYGLVKLFARGFKLCNQL